MVTRGIRTPKRRKLWMRTNFANNIVTGGAPDAINLLSSGIADIGGFTGGFTVIRTVGNVVLQEVAAASTPAYNEVFLGLAWHDPNVTPEPAASGTREAQWLWTGKVEGQEQSSGIIVGKGALAVPESANRTSFDCTQMRKQPTPQLQFSLVYSEDVGAFETSKMRVAGEISVLIALP